MSDQDVKDFEFYEDPAHREPAPGPPRRRGDRALVTKTDLPEEEEYEGLRQLTVIGFYTDTLDEQNYYASHFWAENSEHAIEQARNEVGEEAATVLVIVAVLEGRCLLAPGSP
jgi:hypothetical protein